MSAPTLVQPGTHGPRAAFAKAAVPVTYMRFTRENWPVLNNWLAAEIGVGKFYFLVSGDELSLHIETAEGPRDCPPGYVVVKGTQGEFYPVPPEAFAAKYDTEVPA